MDIDFEGGVQSSQTTNPAQTEETNVGGVAQEDVTNLHGNDVSDVNETKTTTTTPVEKNNDEGNTDDNSSTGELAEGTEVEVDGKVYVVDANNNLVDKEGNVFVESKDLENWLKENNATDSEDVDSDDISISSIQKVFGIDVTDENGNVVEFTNDANGIKSYVDAVVGIKSRDISEGAINKLFTENPLLKQFVDYVSLTGTPRGFGDIPDRSGIQLDKDNENQLIAVIKMAASEFGNASLNDNYISYLKSNGALYDEAKQQLDNLVQKDIAYRQNLEEQAKAAREQEQQELTEYWQGVANAIDKRVISGYKIPETFVKEVNGTKITLTPNDFYDYLSKGVIVDGQDTRMTGYQRDLENLTEEEALNRELLDAWLMFTGGSYKDLVNMAIKENEVRRLVIKSKQQKSAKSVRVVNKQKTKVNPEDILF